MDAAATDWAVSSRVYAFLHNADLAETANQA
jgi:hypothetical protein